MRMHLIYEVCMWLEPIRMVIPFQLNEPPHPMMAIRVITPPLGRKSACVGYAVGG